MLSRAISLLEVRSGSLLSLPLGLGLFLECLRFSGEGEDSDSLDTELEAENSPFLSCSLFLALSLPLFTGEGDLEEEYESSLCFVLFVCLGCLGLIALSGGGLLFEYFSSVLGCWCRLVSGDTSVRGGGFKAELCISICLAAGWGLSGYSRNCLCKLGGAVSLCSVCLCAPECLS